MRKFIFCLSLLVASSLVWAQPDHAVVTTGVSAANTIQYVIPLWLTDSNPDPSRGKYVMASGQGSNLFILGGNVNAVTCNLVEVRTYDNFGGYDVVSVTGKDCTPTGTNEPSVVLFGASSLFTGDTIPYAFDLADWTESATLYFTDGTSAALTSLKSDSDFDTVGDSADNCILVPNSAQEDWPTTNQDGYGVVCDMDSDDNGAVDGVDFLAFGTCFNTSPGPGDACSEFDSDASGAIDGTDNLFFGGNRFGKGVGPSCKDLGTTWGCP